MIEQLPLESAARHGVNCGVGCCDEAVLRFGESHTEDIVESEKFYDVWIPYVVVEK
jgi:hypothetical protein